MRTCLPRPTYAQATATLALFVALGGTGYAATTIGTNQIADGAVTTPKIKDSAVTAAKLKGNSVTGAKLASHSVTTSKIAAGAVTASQIAPGALAGITGTPGAQGPAGPQGATGPRGAAGPSDTYAVFRQSGTIPAMLGTPTTVTFMQVPAGGWLMQANVVLTNTAASARVATCTVMANGVTVDSATASLEATGASDTQTVALAGTIATNDQSIPALLCTTSGGLAGVQFADGDLIATQVGTLHQLAPRP